MTKSIITVFGATGAQGGSVVDAILEDPALKEKWQVRAVTRDATKESAKELAARGCEVVTADLDDKASLVKAMEGAHTAFGVTDYWTRMDMQYEIQQGKNLADAAKEAGVKHLIWSSLMNINKVTNGVLPDVYHFDSKAAVEDYIRSIGIPATFCLAGLYMSMIPSNVMFRRDPPPNGPYVMALPTTPSAKAPMLDTRRDMGKFVRGMIVGFEEGTVKSGDRVLAATAYYTLQEVIDTFCRVYPEAGKGARFVEVTPEQYKAGMMSAGLPEHVGLEVAQNMQVLGMEGYFGGASLDESIKLTRGTPLTGLEEYFRRTELK